MIFDKVRSSLWKLRLILREDKFRHNLHDFLNPICSFRDTMETTIHYLLHCPIYLHEMKGGHSWATFSIGETFMIKMVLISRYFLYLAFLQIMMHQIYIFWMLPSHICWLLKDLTSFLLTLESFERLAFFNIYLNTTDSNNSSPKT